MIIKILYAPETQLIIPVKNGDQVTIRRHEFRSEKNHKNEQEQLVDFISGVPTLLLEKFQASFDEIFDNDASKESCEHIDILKVEYKDSSGHYRQVVVTGTVYLLEGGKTVDSTTTRRICW